MKIATRKGTLVAVLALSSSACATSSNVFATHESSMAQRAAHEASEARIWCPVVVSNGTDQMLEVRYQAGGTRGEVGLLPSGQQTRFDVACSFETVRGYGSVAVDGAYTPFREFETRVRLDRSNVSFLRFSETHAVR